MNTNISLVLQNMQKKQAVIELENYNEKTLKYGLVLSTQDITQLVDNRFESLKSTGRIEFAGGVLPKIVEAFYDSPYIIQENYKETLEELQECFYFFKNETMDRLSDDELIEFMKNYFDGEGQGSIEYLSGTKLEQLSRALKDI